MSRPQVFFDITIGGKASGRIVMEVGEIKKKPTSRIRSFEKEAHLLSSLFPNNFVSSAIRLSCISTKFERAFECSTLPWSRPNLKGAFSPLSSFSNNGRKEEWHPPFLIEAHSF